MAYTRSGGLLGPWSPIDKFMLMLSVLVGLMILVFLNVPTGVVALGLLIVLSGIWREPGQPYSTNPDYDIRKFEYKIAMFFVVFKNLRKVLLAPVTSLGFGPPTEDIDHGYSPGFTPIGRLSAFWALFCAVPLALLDWGITKVAQPIWGDVLLPWPIASLISLIAWFALIQSSVAVFRHAKYPEFMSNMEPAPATMLTKVKELPDVSDVRKQALGFGIGLALIFLIATRAASTPWWITGVLMTIGFVSVFLIRASQIISRQYREQWNERNARRAFWQEAWAFKKSDAPNFVAEVDLPTFDMYLEDDPDQENPYDPKIRVATFAFPLNTTFADYAGSENRLEGPLSTSSISITPVGNLNENGEEISGTVGVRGLRVWWSEETLAVEDLLNPESKMDDFTRTLAAQALVTRRMSELRAIPGAVVMTSCDVITRARSVMGILDIKINVQAGQSLPLFMSTIDQMQRDLGVGWVRMYSQGTGSISILIAMQDPVGIEGVKFKNPARLVNKMIQIANWTYYFTQTGVAVNGETPRLLGSPKAITPLINELTFELPGGMKFNWITGQQEQLESISRNAFLEIGKMKPINPAGLAPDEIEKKEQERISRFTMISAKTDPLNRLFFFGDYKDRIIKGREEGKASIEWHPGIQANDTLAKDSFDDDAPHLLLAGSSGSGKTVVLHNFIGQLASNNSPSDAKIWAVEPKIGLQRYKNIDIVEKFVDSWTPSDEFFSNVDDLFQEAVVEMVRRNKILIDNVSTDGFLPEKLPQARRIANAEGPSADGTPHPLLMPYLFIIVEECATIFADAANKDEKQIQGNILYNAARIAREGRSAGVYMIMTTQYPTNASIPSIIRNQMRRVGLSCQNALASRVVIDQNGLENLTLKGTGMVKENGVYRQFRGLLMQDGIPSMGEPNDILDLIGTLPQKTGSDKLWTPNSEIVVPDPSETVFNEFVQYRGMKLDDRIEHQKETRDISEGDFDRLESEFRDSATQM